jgi:hypothetical protein
MSHTLPIGNTLSDAAFCYGAPYWLIYRRIHCAINFVSDLNYFARLQSPPFASHFFALHTILRYAVTARNIA